MSNATLPWWNSLINWEEIVDNTSFASSITTAYISTEVSITNKRLIAHFPKIVLWLFPLWFETVTMNLKQISSVKIDVQYAIMRIIIAIVAIIVGLNSSWIFFLIWLFFLSSGISVYTVVQGSGWSTEYIPVVFWQKSLANKFVKKLNETIANNS